MQRLETGCKIQELVAPHLSSNDSLLTRDSELCFHEGSFVIGDHVKARTVKYGLLLGTVAAIDSCGNYDVALDKHVDANDGDDDTLRSLPYNHLVRVTVCCVLMNY